MFHVEVKTYIGNLGPLENGVKIGVLDPRVRNSMCLQKNN